MEQTVSTIPEDFNEITTAADIQITSNGKFVYAANRVGVDVDGGASTPGDGAISIFEVDNDTGHLTLTGLMGSGGQVPRSLAIDPSDHIMVVCNQESHSVTTFFIDQDYGVLEPTGEKLGINSPACVKIGVC